MGVGSHNTDRLELDEDLRELGRLVDTWGADVAATVVQIRSEISPAFLIGRGKALSLAGQRRSAGAQLIVFDSDLSPVQHKNLESLIGARVMDRCGLIIEIFSKHARTHEAKVQVELARNRYLLPRLTHAWSHLSRQRGGLVVRGAGETQLEVDRRMVRQRISGLQRKLEMISRQRETRRQGRGNVFQVALVGYTNSGKSTLMNALTQSDCLVQDRLFATLDSTVRTIRPPDQPRVLLTDTVGFIRKLPPSLVASFMSTLEEIKTVDLLLHVVDLSDPHFEKKITVTRTVLDDLSISHIPVILVFNKIDLLGTRSKLAAIVQSIYKRSLAVSGSTREGIEGLKQAVREHFEQSWQERVLELAYGRTELLSEIYATAKVLGVDYLGDRMIVRFKTSDTEFRRLAAQAKPAPRTAARRR